MNRLFAYAAATVLVLLTGCQQTKPLTATKTKDLVDPELTINGVPGNVIESGTTFSVTLTTKSTGDITLSVDKPTVASVSADGDKAYKVSVVSMEDVTVTLVASQGQDKTYKAVSVKQTFSVKGAGSQELPGPNDPISGTAVNYTEANGPVASPERGMYKGYEVRSSTEPLSAAVVKARRASDGCTLWLLEFYLTDFITSDISTTYLNKMQACFDAVRDGGAKAIVRYAYRDNNAHLDEDQEAKPVQMQKHIAQIKPYLIKNEDVIFVLQAGFIGSWGEWYYTTYFSSLTERRKIVDLLLESLPSSRQIELRTPAFKMKMYNLALKDTLTAETAHDGSVTSRLAGHNDCFGADKNDEGTFDGDDTRKFWKAETRYAIMGGETCKVSDYCLCPQTLKDLEDYHWTYLHDGYNQQVLSRWETDGCMDEIKTRLGYRLVLKDVHYDAINPGQKCKVTIRMYNKGYAAPMNPREAWLVWVGSDGNKVKTMLGADPRNWHSGYNAVVSFFTPTTAKGTLYLELSDPLIKDNPAYSIALANANVFDDATGYNKLFEVK